MQTPTGLAPLSSGHYLQQQQTARSASSAAQDVWRAMPTASLAERFAYWRKVIPSLASTVTLAQYEAATRASTYVETAAALQGITANDVPTLAPSAFLSATDDVEEWLKAPMLHLARLVVNGAPAVMAGNLALSTLVRQVSTLTQDAGREATGVGIAANTGFAGYHRRLQTPSCARCAVLAGRWYLHDAGFDRHPVCDCVQVPAAEDYDDAGFDAAEEIRAGRVTGLSKGDTRAIVEDGADPSQVINAKRAGSVQRTRMYGQTVKTTTSSTTKRGAFYVPKTPRLTPDAIYKAAGGDRQKTIDLLAKYRYTA